MALRRSRMLSLLFVLFVSTLFLMVSWGYLSVNIRTAYSAEESLISIYHRKGNLSRSPEKSHTANNAKLPDPPTTDLQEELDRVSASPAAVAAETPMPILYRKDFRKLPQWDFEDVYNQDSPPWPTTCAQSLRNSQDENFRKAFLPNVRLYLHKDNINISEWNRLSHFNNPFGFMDFKYQDVMASVKLIPEPREPLLSPKPGGDGCIRCAVVGTAGILNGSKMGKEIDAHDYVFRMNGAIVKGYEEDVGSRTSVYVHTAHAITSSPYMLRKYGYKAAPQDEGIKYVLIPEGMRDFSWLEGLLKRERVSAGPYKNRRPITYYREPFDDSRFYVLHQDFLRYVRNRFLKSRNLNARFWAIVRPTNGAFALFLALHTCDVVDAYGFMTEDYRKYSNYYVQRNIKTKVVFYANHDYLLEMNLWKNLHNSKIMKLYQRTNSDTQKPKQ